MQMDLCLDPDLNMENYLGIILLGPNEKGKMFLRIDACFSNKKNCA